MVDNVLLFVGLIIGIICCLFGLKFQKLILSLVGLALGFNAGIYLVDMFSLTGGLEIVVKFGSALVLGVLSFSLFESLLAIVVAIGLFIIVSGLFDNNLLGYIVGAISGLIGGVLTHKFYKLGVIIFTSVSGAFLITNCLVNYVDYSYMIIFSAIAIGTIIFQVFTNKIFS